MAVLKQKIAFCPTIEAGLDPCHNSGRALCSSTMAL